MPYMLKDSAAANEQRTAIRIEKHTVSGVDRDITFRPTYMAVRGDAGTIASMLLLKQKKAMWNMYLGIALLIMIAGAIIILICFGPGRVWKGLTLIAAIAAVTPLYFTSGSIRAEGIKINETVYRNLTPEDRDSLFLARDKHLANAALTLLTERYTETEELHANEARKRVEEEVRRNREKALALLNRTGSPGALTPKEVPDSHD